MPWPPDHAKRARVRALLEDERWTMAPVAAVAREAGVSPPLVCTVRRQMGLAPSGQAQRREEALRLLEDPQRRVAPNHELAAQAGVSEDTIWRLRRLVGAPLPRRGPVRKALPVDLNSLSRRHVQLLGALFDAALRGGDVQSLVLSEPGRQIHQAIVAAKRGPMEVR